MCRWGELEDVRLNRPRPTSGRVVVPVDSCIAALVQALQDHGVRTTGCCCGHGKGLGFVAFEDKDGVVREIPLERVEWLSDEGAETDGIVEEAEAAQTPGDRVREGSEP